MAQNELEKVAIEARQNLLTNNLYNGFDVNNNYSSTHTRALRDELTPNAGKGTGVDFDTYNGGSAIDEFGHPQIPGSGRVANVITNEFNEDNPYTTPDMTGNIGQVTI